MGNSITIKIDSSPEFSKNPLGPESPHPSKLKPRDAHDLEVPNAIFPAANKKINKNI